MTTRRRVKLPLIKGRHPAARDLTTDDVAGVLLKQEVAASYDDLFRSVSGIAKEMQALNRQAVQAYTPIVEDILRTRSRDVNHIEHTLDHLLDFCSHASALALFKKLCRYYWEIDPAATARQVHAYRDMWDAEDETVEPGATP